MPLTLSHPVIPEAVCNIETKDGFLSSCGCLQISNLNLPAGQARGLQVPDVHRAMGAGGRQELRADPRPAESQALDLGLSRAPPERVGLGRLHQISFAKPMTDIEMRLES